MEYLIPSFLAGVLTILSPCVVVMLPIILGGTVGEKDPFRPLIIATALGISVIVSTLALKATILFIVVPQSFWTTVSGLLVVLFGISMFTPVLWEKISFKLKLYKTEQLLYKSTKKKGNWGAVVLGASLGPVFTTCSPTYTLILAIILPANLYIGTLNLLSYTLGLTALLLAIGYGGHRVSKKIKFMVNPQGWFKRSLGALLIITGLFIFTGLDKAFESAILDAGYKGPIELEASILNSIESPE